MVELSTASLSVRLTPATREMIKRLAKVQKQTVSETARILIVQGLIRHSAELRKVLRKTALALPIGLALATQLPGRSVIMPPLHDPPAGVWRKCANADCWPFLPDAPSVDSLSTMPLPPMPRRRPTR